MKNENAQTRMECRLQVLTPVHVGCDEVYEPTGFVVDEEKNRLIIFDPTDFIEGLNGDDRERFSAICRKGTIASILEVYKFLRNRPVDGREVKLCSGFADHYRQVLNLSPQEAKKQLNRFEIKRTAFSPSDNRPYIPGSAIKGALRTGYLNDLASAKHGIRIDLGRGKGKKGKWDNRHKVLENKLLSLDRVQPKDRISRDPFRMVKVSDFMPVGEAETRILYAVNWKKNPSGGEGRGPYQMLEMIEPGTCFMGEIRVDMPQAKDAVSMAVTLKELIEGCQRFFQKEMTREKRELRAIGCKSTHQTSINGSMLLRVGQHSGAECVTIEGYREIWIKGKNKGRTEDHATTLWLASERDKPEHPDYLVPFGWTHVDELGADDLKDLMNQDRSFKNERNRLLRERQENAQALLKKEQDEEERLRRLQAEKEAKKAAEEKRQAELKAMSPEQRVIAEIEAGIVIENRVVEIYMQMQDFSDAFKKKAAQALKQYWQAEGKWSGKQSKKQKEKVRTIKNILGE